jgi:predicted RNase H-like nuclease (RuvC/YqgF family)
MFDLALNQKRWEIREKIKRMIMEYDKSEIRYSGDLKNTIFRANNHANEIIGLIQSYLETDCK